LKNLGTQQWVKPLATAVGASPSLAARPKLKLNKPYCLQAQESSPPKSLFSQGGNLHKRGFPLSSLATSKPIFSEAFLSVFVEFLSWLDEVQLLAATLRTYTSSLNSSLERQDESEELLSVLALA